jgi:hypothetical protein
MHIVLDRGHGIDTPGKRSPIWKNDTQLIEWEFNQRVIDKVACAKSAHVHLRDLPKKKRGHSSQCKKILIQ